MSKLTVSLFKMFTGFSSDVEGTLGFFMLCTRLVDDFNLARIPLLICSPSRTLFLFSWQTFSLVEVLSLLSLSKRAAEEEKTETVLDRVRERSEPLFDPGLVEDGRGETEDGTRTTEKMRWAPTRVSWSGWTIAGSNWWNKVSGNDWKKEAKYIR